MTNPVKQQRSRWPEKAAANSGPIGKAFDVADASLLFNPKGATKSFPGFVKSLVHSTHYGLRLFPGRIIDFDTRRIVKINEA